METGTLQWPLLPPAAPSAAQPEPQRRAGGPGEAAWGQYRHGEAPAQVRDRLPPAVGRCVGGSRRAPGLADACWAGQAGPCALVASLRSGEQARLPTPQACPIRAGPRWAVCRSPELGLAFPLWPGDEMIHGQQGEAVWEASCPPRAPPFPFPALGKPRALDGGTGTTPFLSWAPQNPSHGRRSLLPEGK